jgi:hypothetical protein
MWEENKQKRLGLLQEVEEQGEISESESAELMKLTDERVQWEAEAVSSAALKMTGDTEQTRNRIQETEAQSAALEQLIGEQERYLSEVSSLISEMENRRRKWRQRYRRLTGRPLKEPISQAGTR